PARPHLCDGAAHRRRQGALDRRDARRAVADPPARAVAAFQPRDVLCAYHAHAGRPGRALSHRGADRAGICVALMNPVLTTRLAKLRQSLAVAGYLATIVVLLVLTFTAIAGILDQRAAVVASADLLAQLEGRRSPSSRPGEAPAAAIPTGSPFLE